MLRHSSNQTCEVILQQRRAILHRILSMLRLGFLLLDLFGLTCATIHWHARRCHDVSVCFNFWIQLNECEKTYNASILNEFPSHEKFSSVEPNTVSFPMAHLSPKADFNASSCNSFHFLHTSISVQDYMIYITIVSERKKNRKWNIVMDTKWGLTQNSIIFRHGVPGNCARSICYGLVWKLQKYSMCNPNKGKPRMWETRVCLLFVSLR